MSIVHRPKIRFNDQPENSDTSPIEATMQSDGRIRVEVDPDSGRLCSSHMTTDTARQFALELLGLCDAADAIEASWATAFDARARP